MKSIFVGHNSYEYEFIAVDRHIQNFSLLYEGRYEVADIKHANAYLVVDPATREPRGIFNALFLRQYRVPINP